MFSGFRYKSDVRFFKHGKSDLFIVMLAFLNTDDAQNIRFWVYHCLAVIVVFMYKAELCKCRVDFCTAHNTYLSPLICLYLFG